MSLTIATGAIVCNESQLVGEISIGTRTVVHPKVCVKCSYKKLFFCPPVKKYVDFCKTFTHFKRHENRRLRHTFWDFEIQYLQQYHSCLGPLWSKIDLKYILHMWPLNLCNSRLCIPDDCLTTAWLSDDFLISTYSRLLWCWPRS